MTVSKTTTQDLVHEFIERKVRELAIGSGVLMQDLFCEFADSLTAELQKENARLREALQFIHDTFKKDEDEGYSSRDRQFAIDITKAALAGWHSQDARPSKGGEVQVAALSKEKE